MIKRHTIHFVCLELVSLSFEWAQCKCPIFPCINVTLRSEYQFFTVYQQFWQFPLEWNTARDENDNADHMMLNTSKSKVTILKNIIKATIIILSTRSGILFILHAKRYRVIKTEHFFSSFFYDSIIHAPYYVLFAHNVYINIIQFNAIRHT